MSKDQILAYWIKSLDLVGLKPEVKDIYIRYITPLINNDVPIIFDFKHLHLLLGRSPKYLSSVINANDNHYRTFTIPKKKGGHREITAPYPALMECQYWIYHNILTKIKVHPAAHGFTSDKSIITNSSFHIEQQQFLKIDIKDFFPSIKLPKIISVFRKLGYSHKVSFYLAKICSYNDALPQGAPTSPALSNIIVKQLDKRLLLFAKKLNLRYTRYADDLAFSGTHIHPKFINYISKIIKDFDLTINQQKTILQCSRGKRILTGISIADKKLKIPKSYKRKLRQEVHFIRKYGLSSHIRKLKIRHPNYLQSVIGKLGFWLDVEPDSTYPKKALIDLKDLQF
jgi:retron-type reverse transcriptase